MRLYTKTNGVSHETILDFHQCTAEDYEQFAPPTADSLALLEHYKTDDKRGLFCLDWDQLGDELNLWGINDEDFYQRVEFLLVPCNYVHAEFGDYGDTISPECIANHTAQMAYLGNF